MYGLAKDGAEHQVDERQARNELAEKEYPAGVSPIWMPKSDTP
jgi:hypothetical protein